MPPKVQKKPVTKKVAENPFDKFANSRKKHEVINRRVKGEDRNVGRARTKAIDERKKKLLTEFRTMKKSNTFADRRFGESDATLSLEDKMFMRFQKEKAAKVRNLSMYNLDSTEDTVALTHKGQSLGEASAMDDWPSSEDEGLGKDIVENLHFGGGLVHKPSSEHISDARKSREDILQEIVMKSKLRKLEKREAREEQDNQLENLDKAYAELISGAMLEFKPTKWDRNADDEEAPAGGAGDDAEYDTAFRAMAFESRLKATDRTKSQEEVAQEELEKLEALEKERLARMMPQESRAPTAATAADRTSKKRSRVTDDEVDDEGWNMPNDDESDEEGDDESGDSAEEDGSDDDIDEDSEMESEEEDSEEEELGSDDDEEKDEESDEQEDENEDVDTKVAIDHINDLMPHILPCPSTYEAFQSLLTKYATGAPDSAVVLVQRIMTANSVHLPGDRGVSNKPKMIAFMEILLQYFMSLGDSLVTAKDDAAAGIMQQVTALTKALYTLAHDLPDQATTLFMQTLKSIQSAQQKNFKSLAEGKSSVALWPSLGSIFYFQLMGHIYSVSDYRHAVITPLMLYLSQCLSQCPVRHSPDAASGLLVTSVLLQYTEQAKKLLPEALTFLSLVFRQCFTDRIQVHSDNGECDVSWRCFNVRHTSNNSDLAILRTAIVALRALVARYSDVTAFPELFSRLYNDLKTVKVAAGSVATLQSEALAAIQLNMQNQLKTRKPLQWRVPSKFVLQTLAPRFEENYSMKKDMDADTEKAKVKQLNRQLKREKKAAVRELRRDADFLDEQMYNEKMAVLAEGRAERAKNYEWMAEQQATMNQQVRMGKGLMKGGGSGSAPKPRQKRQKR